jgi:CheY-like chemotaxis protein
MRVLIVDDEIQIAAMLREMLEWEHYEVRVARNGRDALESLASFHADLILSDVMMPVMDGVEFCRALAAHPAYRNIPIILASAAGRSVHIEECAYATFFTKPFNIPDLLSAIRRYAGGDRD